jgi:hypothetical protein
MNKKTNADTSSVVLTSAELLLPNISKKRLVHKAKTNFGQKLFRSIVAAGSQQLQTNLARCCRVGL